MNEGQLLGSEKIGKLLVKFSMVSGFIINVIGDPVAIFVLDMGARKV